jgi:hypothetical protein
MSKPTPHDYSWNLHIIGYKNPYDPDAEWANDWLDSSVTFFRGNEIQTFSLNHLLIEELEDFYKWLTKIYDGQTVPQTFEFVDSELWLELIESDPLLTLRLTYGLEVEKRVVIDFPIRQGSRLLNQQIEKVAKLLTDFPCRCGMEHNLFSKQF